jgi:hypothetical protein
MTKRLLLLIASISLAVAGAADKFSVNLIQPTTVNGTTFKPGDARVELQDNKVIIKQGKVSAEATVKVEANKTKYIYTGVGYKEGTDHQIREISIGGTTTHILFEDGARPAKSE